MGSYTNSLSKATDNSGLRWVAPPQGECYPSLKISINRNATPNRGRAD
jgi:hypothetical protein